MKEFCCFTCDKFVLRGRSNGESNIHGCHAEKGGIFRICRRNNMCPPDVECEMVTSRILLGCDYYTPKLMENIEKCRKCNNYSMKKDLCTVYHPFREPGCKKFETKLVKP